jgi:hypothetical protein
LSGISVHNSSVNGLDQNSYRKPDGLAYACFLAGSHADSHQGAYGLAHSLPDPRAYRKPDGLPDGLAYAGTHAGSHAISHQGAYGLAHSLPDPRAYRKPDGLPDGLAYAGTHAGTHQVAYFLN